MKPWPRIQLPAGTVEYKRDASPARGHWTSYMVSMTYGLLIGRVYSVVFDRRLRWYATGWTPNTEDQTFGPFGSRREAIGALVDAEVELGRPVELAA